MKTLNFCCHALPIGFAAAILAACGGNQSAAPQLPATSVHIGTASVAHSAHRVSPDRIVYTPAFIQIENSYYYLDLNNDKITDFVISEYNMKGSSCGTTDYNGALSLDGAGSNGIEVSGVYAAQLVSGSPIGSGQSFSTGSRKMEDAFDFVGGPHCTHIHGVRGNWPPNTSGYLGLAFVIRGKTHYGWAALAVSAPRSGWLSATLTGYAYQTIAGKSIKAGQM